jgi:hypothetical protein
MTDVLSIRVGETIRSAGMVKKADGDAIVGGTVNYYLLRDSDGEYWNDAAGVAGEWTTDQSKTANPMTHRGDGLWTVTLRSSPFESGVVYVEWAEESGGLHVPAEGRLLRGVVESTPQTGDSFARLGAPAGASVSADIEAVKQAIDALPAAAAVAIFNDQTYDTIGVEIDAGAIDSGTTADTLTIGTPLVFSSSGAGIDVNFEFQLGLSRVSELVATGYYTGTGGPATSKYMDVYLWDYSLATPDWVLITDGSNRIPFGSTNTTREYVIAPQFQDPATGVVKVRYLSSRTNAGDTFVLDQHFIEGVNTGATLGEIANAVHSFQIPPEAAQDGTHSRAMWYLFRSVAAVFSIDSVSGSEITCSGDRFDASADYVGHTVQFHLGGTNDYRFARVTAQAANVLTVDAIQDVTDEWHGYILPQRPITAAIARTQVDAALEDDPTLNKLDSKIEETPP